MLLVTALLAGVALCVPNPGCVDKSTNCEQVTHGGKKRWCTNSGVCPTCGTYMRDMCAGTCSKWYEECGGQTPTDSSDSKDSVDVDDDELAFCFQPDVYLKDPLGDSLIKNVRNTWSTENCAEECVGQFGCRFFTYQGATKDCFLYKSYNGVIEAKNNGFVSGNARCPKCHSMNTMFNSDPDDVVATHEGVNDMSKCMKKCRKHDDCEYVQYHLKKKTCKLLDDIDAEDWRYQDDWVTSNKKCDAAENISRSAMTIAGVGPNALLVAGAGLAVAGAAAAWALRSRKQEASVEEPLLAQAA